MVTEDEKRGFEFKLATSEDAPAMVSFHNAYYSAERKPEQWLWEYQTYEPEKAVFAFARYNGEVIATQGGLPVYLEVGSECVLSGKIESTLCLPSYRGTRIFKGLVEYALEIGSTRGIQLIWGFTPYTPVAKLAIKTFRFTRFPDIQVLTRPGNIWVSIVLRLRGEGSLWQRTGSAGKSILKSLFIKRNRNSARIEKRAGYEIKKGRIANEDLKALYQRLRLKYKNAVFIRFDEKYLNWRVREHPFLKYTEYQVYQGDKLRAYAFVVLSQGTASISDLLSEDEYATSLLLHTILRDYRKKAGQFRFMGNPRDSLAEDLVDQLHQFGFSVSGNWYFCIRNLTDIKNEQVFDIRNWHVTGLWTEGFLY